MPTRLTPRRAAGSVVRPLRHALAERETLRGVRRYARNCSAEVIVCWDLDNTLVDSGTLLRQGMSLADAIVVASPMSAMLEFYASVSESVKDAQHVVLSARGRALRLATRDWLGRHGLEIADDRIWLVPDARAKLAVWQSLARCARLVIVDDLSFGHEGDVRLPYADLVDAVSELAAVYVGLDDITAVVEDPLAGKRLAGEVAERVRA